MAYVYKHIRKDNNQPFYIGVGGLITFDYYSRAKGTSSAGKRNRDLKWYDYVNIYGFNHEIVLDNCSADEAFEKETELIAKYGRIDLKTGILINKTNGGKGTKGFSEDTRKKCGQSNIGKILSREKRQEISKRNKGRKHSEESKKKISSFHKGRQKSQDHLDKLIKTSPFKKGSIPWNKGLKYERKGGNTNNKIVVNLETGIFYNSIQKASEQSFVKPTRFRKMLTGEIQNITSFIIIDN
jgi:hypothetical protein